MRTSIKLSITLALLLAAGMPGADAKGSKSDSPECAACIKSATALFAQGKNMDAMKLLKNNQEQCKNSERFNLLLSTVLLRMRSHEQEAADAAAIAVHLNPTSTAANMQYGVCLMATGQKPQAIAAFETLTKLDPASYEAWSALSTLYTETGDNEKAKVCGNKASCLEPGSRSARLRTAQNLFKAGNATALSSELGTLIADDDLEPEFFIVLSKEALSMNAYPEAIKAADKALAAYPKATDVIKTKAEAELWNRDYESALKTVARLDPKVKDDVDGNAVKALVLMRLGRTQEAVPVLARIPERTDDSVIATFAKAVAHERNGNVQAAIKGFEGSLSTNQAFGPAHVELARIYLRLGKDDDALTESRESLRSKPFVSSGKAIESRLALEGAPAKEKMDEAMRLAREAMKSNAEDPEALIALGLCELKGARMNAATDLIKRAIEIEPGNIDAQLAQAKLYEGAGDHAKRLEVLKEAQTMAEGDSEVLVALAQAYVDNNDGDSALAVLKQGMAAHKSDAVLAFALARAYERKGNSEEAVKYFKQSLAQGLKGARAILAKEALRHLGDSQEPM